MKSPIQFVGDPFVDAGVAVLENKLGKECVGFTRADLSAQADELERIYSSKAWAGYLTVHFPNSCWCNPTMSADNRAKQKASLLRSFDGEPIRGKLCVYCGKAAQLIGDRSTVPLVTGAASMTAGAGGEPGLPICAGCQFAIQFYPLAAMKVEGRPLFWWTPDHRWMFHLTLDFADEVERLIKGSPDEVPSIRWPATQMLKAVEAVFDKTGDELSAADLVGCHVTNYGSGPEYDEIRVRKEVVAFVKFGLGHPAYRAIRDDSWEVPSKKKKKGEAEASSKPSESRRNLFFEEIGGYLRDGADRCECTRRNGMRPSRSMNSGIIRQYFQPNAGKHSGVFELACVFSRKVLRMTQEQVEAIKKIGDQIAASAKASDHLRRLFQSKRPLEYVRTLTEISDRMKRGGEAPIVIDTVLSAFDMTGEDDAFVCDAGVVWELILLRLIEKLPAERVPELKLEEGEEAE